MSKSSVFSGLSGIFFTLALLSGCGSQTPTFSGSIPSENLSEVTMGSFVYASNVTFKLRDPKEAAAGGAPVWPTETLSKRYNGNLTIFVDMTKLTSRMPGDGNFDARDFKAGDFQLWKDDQPFQAVASGDYVNWEVVMQDGEQSHFMIMFRARGQSSWQKLPLRLVSPNASEGLVAFQQEGNIYATKQSAAPVPVPVQTAMPH